MIILPMCLSFKTSGNRAVECMFVMSRSLQREQVAVDVVRHTGNECFVPLEIESVGLFASTKAMSESWLIPGNSWR